VRELAVVSERVGRGQWESWLWSVRELAVVSKRVDSDTVVRERVSCG
jgi:hypothetical protein